MGEPAAHLTVNGTKLQSQGACPRLCEGISVEQFWTQFWNEGLQALKRHIESTQTSSDTSRCRRPLGAIDG